MVTDGGDAAALASLRALPHALICTTAAGAITVWNDGATALYGFSAQEMLGADIDRLIPVSWRAGELARRARVLAGSYDVGHYPRIHADGHLIDAVTSMWSVDGPGAGDTRVASLSRQRTPAEIEHDRYAALMEAAPDAMVFVGPDGAIVLANHHVEELFGYAPSELIGQPVELLLPEALRAAHSGHRAAYARRPRVRAMGSGLSLLARRRDGTTVPVEISLAPEPSEGSGLVIASIRDITLQRSLERAVRDNEMRLRQVADSVDIVFVLLEVASPRPLYVSAAAGLVLGDLPDADPLDALLGPASVHPEDRDRVAAEFVAAVRSGTGAQSEHRLVTTTGEVRWIRAVATPVPMPSETPDRTVITVQDISERVLAADVLRAAEARARAASDAKNAFLSGMSHELRTPLNAILGFGQLLQRQLGDTEHGEAIHHVLKGGRHLLDLINDVLDIARIESGDLPLSLEPVAVGALAAESVQLMHPLAESAGITLQASGSTGAHYVRADRQRLRQALLSTTTR